MILYYKSNLVYIVVFPQFLIFQKNNSRGVKKINTDVWAHYYFVEKLKIVEKQLCKLHCSYGKVSHALNFKIQILVNFKILVQVLKLWIGYP